MPFTTEITNVKSEINAGLAASQYTAKDLVYVSKAIEALAAAEMAAGTFDNVTIASHLYVGPGSSTFAAGLTYPMAVFQTEQPDYTQIAFRNTSNAANASTDLILYTNDGTDESGWIDMGITSTNFADPDFTITGKGDGYIFVSGSGNDGNDRGNLVLATDSTGTQNKIIFAAGGLASDNTQMVITPDANVHIEINTPSTSPSTGALTVVGGVGIQGDVNIQGDITFGGTGTTLTTTTLSVSDAQVTVGSGNTTDALDLGIVGNYGVGGTAKYTGIVRDATDGIYKFFKDTTVAPASGIVNFAGAGLEYATIKVGGAEIGSVSNTEIGYLDGVTSAIQTQLDSKAVYPSQTSQSGNFLTTDGTNASWAAVYPSQTGNSGKYLTTNGSVTSWATVDALPSQTNNSGKYLTTNGTSASWATITTDPLPDVFLMMGA
jgi:hypothetical protein